MNIAQNKTFEEYRRVLRSTGKVIVITTSEEGYANNLASFINDHSENVSPKSGDKAKCVVRDTDIVFWDCFWTDSDYREVFSKCGFQVLQLHVQSAEGSEPFQYIFPNDPESEVKRGPPHNRFFRSRSLILSLLFRKMKGGT